jgi:predicted 3-demethylubiquinone-9 3-methyltransferase (glyoxalase superfamily)
MQKITPFFWFDNQAEEAVNFYAGIFSNSAINKARLYSEEGKEIHGMDSGTVMTIDFELEGQPFTALNGGPHFQFNPSVSFFVMCDSEKNVDQLWRELGDEGEVLMPLNRYPWSEKYGWLQDRYGITWQISLDDKEEVGGQSITPCMMFTGDQYGRAEAAIEFYQSVFNQSSAGEIHRYGKDENPDREGAVKHARFTIEDQVFMILESAHDHSFEMNEAISFVVNCHSADEVDHYWEKLKHGGDPDAQQCGWLKDQFDVSWQVVPVQLFDMLGSNHNDKVKRVTHAMLQMKKLDLDKLREEFQ